MSEHDDLSNAIEAGDGATVEELLQKHPDLVNSRDWTPPPLHCAVLWNRPEIAEILLDNGADIEMRDPDRSTTPVRYAVLYGKKEMTRLLLSRGANSGPIVENGTTLLQLALNADSGEFEEYDDMPSRDEYGEIVEMLRQLEVQ